MPNERAFRIEFGRRIRWGAVESPGSVFNLTTSVKGSRLTGYVSTSTSTKAPTPGAKSISGREQGATRTPAVEQGGRSEPHLGGTGAFSADLSSEEQQRRYAFYNQFNAPPSRPRPRVAQVLGVFAIGAVVGLGSAWGLRQPSHTTALGTELPHTMQGAHVSNIQSVRSGSLKGIDPRELPYDGLPPHSAEQATRLKPSRINPEEMPYGGLPPSANRPQPDATRMSQVRKNKQTTATMDEKETQATPAPAATKAAAAKAPKKHHYATRRVAKDREIERIKQQAAEELKKKTENGRMVATESSSHRSVRHHDAPPTMTDKFARTRAMLASCEHARNFFLREKCKWRLCSDSWGKNGCPSYQMQAGSY